MKKTVNYIGKAHPLPFYRDGLLTEIRAVLIPLDHDGPLVVNDTETITSPVIHWNHDTGRIETKNSVYIPVPMPTIEEMNAETAQA